jgi:methionyl-tRNA formyltransferase
MKLCARVDSGQIQGGDMRIVIVGQQAFGKAVLEAFIARGDEIAGVFAAPERPGARPDPLVAAAEEKKLPVHRFPKYSDPEAQNTLRELNADIGVMAYVLLFAPPEFCAIPKHGMIQFHPSLLPLHRGPASIPWAIIRGRGETGLTIFRPTPGLDEGPIILQKRVAIGPDDTAASLYFDKIFPLGVEALVQAADLVVGGRATEWTQDESQATYEGWVREAESRINWASHVDFVYDLIRGCNPAPGAWTMFKPEDGEAQKLYLFDSKKIMAPTFGTVRGKKIGEVVSAGPEGLRILAQGGFIECSRLRLGDGAKVKSSEVDIPVGTILGG